MTPSDQPSLVASREAETGCEAASVRASFVEHFGEDQAESIEDAANEHTNGINDKNRGADPFKWALLICIGYECASKDGYRKHHDITAPWPEVRKWIKEHGQLDSHDGDCDYLAMFAGAYNEFMPTPEGSADLSPDGEATKAKPGATEQDQSGAQ